MTDISTEDMGTYRKKVTIECDTKPNTLLFVSETRSEENGTENGRSILFEVAHPKSANLLSAGGRRYAKEFGGALIALGSAMHKAACKAEIDDASAIQIDREVLVEDAAGPWTGKVCAARAGEFEVERANGARIWVAAEALAVVLGNEEAAPLGRHSHH